VNRYRVEILGAVPSGTSHNEVHATVNSLLRERMKVQSVTKRRLAGGTHKGSGMVSIIAVFEAEDAKTAETEAVYAGRAVPNFSFDIMVREIWH
jgi:hypothetical protein